jgi:hypothetical protein
VTPPLRARRLSLWRPRLVATLAALFVSGCPQRLSPTPKGAVFHAWMSPTPETQLVTRRYRLRLPEGPVADVDLRFGLTAESLTSLRGTLVENYGGHTLSALVTSDSGPASASVAQVLIMANHTGPWTSRGNVYGTSGVIEVRRGFVLTGARGARLPSCAEPPPTDRQGDLCEH